MTKDKHLPDEDPGSCDGAPPLAGELLRCFCGSLLARRVSAGIELKCRRCKRTLIVPLLALEESGSAS